MLSSIELVSSSEVFCASDSQKLALTSPISGGCSVSIVRSRTQGTELVSSSGVLCASVLVKSGLENLDYGHRGSVALTM
jgi:hypothetical protein